ncbi:MAG: CocE/NonD family hydrolase [Cyanobacteriota bacterium]|nr:CocE/NonD family hydrolase [Cyanobacteriota bacterium]
MVRTVVWSDQSLICSDGTALIARVWQPAESGPWPVLLMRQPYGRAIASTPTTAHPSWYAAHGFVVVVQDVRGSGDSGGCFAGFAQEARDSAETVLWARQLPGSNGRLGTYGFSYQGLTQLLNHDPQGRAEALPDALAPAMCGLDERRHWCASGGAHWWALSLGWGLQLAALQCRRRGDREGWSRVRSSLESGAFVQEGLALLQHCDPTSMVLAWLQRDVRCGQGWSEHAVDPQLWHKPMLLIGGWHDPQLEGVLDLYSRARAAGASPQLRLGAWTHLNWQGGLDRTQLAFFAYHLKGDSPAAAESPACLLQDCLGGNWLQRAPEQASGQRWGLRSTGLAAIDVAEGQLCSGGGEGEVAVVHDPWRPLPGRGGHLGLDAGRCDRADLDARSDVACFTTGPLEADLELFGRPELQLCAAADQPGFDLCVALSRVSSSGAAEQLSTGVLRCLGEDCLKPQLRQVVLQPLLAGLQAGERLRLSIGLAAWPQIAVNPGNGAVPSGCVGTEHRVITVQLTLAGASFCIRPMVDAN